MPNSSGLFPGDPGYVQTPTPQMGTDITSPPTPQQPVGSQNTLTPQQISELNVAAGRNNATDQANLAYAKSHYGFTPDIKPANLSTNTNETALAQGPNPQPSSVTVLGQQVAASGLTAIQQSLTDYLGQQQKITEQQQTAAQAESDTALAGLESATAVSNLDTLKGLEQSAGLEDKRKALTDIMAQINSYKGALEQGLINIEGQPIAMDFIVGQQALLQRQAAAKINTLVAQGALVQDNLNFAIDTVTRYYQAASQDRQDQIERYKTLFTIANDKLIRLDKKEESFVNAQIRILEDADTQQQKDKDKILDLMKSNPDAFKKANISLDQPYEEILKAMLPYMGGTAGDFQSVEVNGKLFTFDKNTGTYIDSGVTVPKQSVGGGGGSGSTIKFTPEDKQRLIAADFTADEIAQIQKDVNEFGLSAVTEGMDEKQKQAIQNVLKGVTPTQEASQNQPKFLSPQYFATLYGNSLEKNAKDAGFVNRGNKLNPFDNKADVAAYIASIMSTVEIYRQAGFTDQEILKMMQ